MDAPLSAPVEGKQAGDFRVYEYDASSLVYRHYHAMRARQCVDFVRRMEDTHLSFDHARMTVLEAFERLKGYVDSSDPDSDNPNLEHMVQAAEGARAAGQPEWMQVIALVHDLGKAMSLWGCPEDGTNGDAASPQFALGGDTWVVGARLPPSTVLPDLNSLNPDVDHPVYGSEAGVYTPHCGMMNLQYAFGHDEYIFRHILHNTTRGGRACPFPVTGLAMLRLHSCYPWHKGGAYAHFMRNEPYDFTVDLPGEGEGGAGGRRTVTLTCPGDDVLLQAVLDFNTHDLYTKAHARPDVDRLWKEHYAALVAAFLPGTLDW